MDRSTSPIYCKGYFLCSHANKTESYENSVKINTTLVKTDKSQRTLYIDDAIYELLDKTKAKQAEYKRSLGKVYNDSEYIFTRDGVAINDT